MPSLYNKVSWSEGMLLKPQHLQQQERYHEGIHTKAMQFLNPHYWGFFELKFDSDYFTRGYLAIERAKGIFKDGTIFNLPDDDNNPPQLNIENLKSGDIIYLCVSSHISNSHNTEMPGQEARYQETTIKLKQFADQSLEECKLAVNMLNLKWLTDLNHQENYEVLEAARVVVDEDTSKLKLDVSFVPPILNIHCNNYLIKHLKITINNIDKKLNTLETINTSFNNNTYKYFFYKKILSKAAIKLKHHLEERKTHPETLYLILTEICFELSYLFDEPQASYRYEHNNLTMSFFKLTSDINDFLKSSIFNDEQEIQLKEDQYGFWISEKLSPDVLVKNLVLSLEYNYQNDISAENILKHLKIGTPRTIYTLVKQALPGIGFSILKETKQKPSKSKNIFYFVIEKNSSIWTELIQEKVLVMQGTHILGKFKAQLWARNE